MTEILLKTALNPNHSNLMKFVLINQYSYTSGDFVMLNPHILIMGSFLLSHPNSTFLTVNSILLHGMHVKILVMHVHDVISNNNVTF